MDYMQLGLSVAVVAASAFGVTQLDPTAHPYGFASAAFCLVQGIMDLMRMLQGDGNCGGSMGNAIVSFIPLPLANMEFYSASGQTNLALLHSLSLILVFYKSVERMSDDDDGCPFDLTVDFSLVLNAASTIYLFVQGGDCIHLGIGLGALFTRYGSMLIDLIMCNEIDFASYLDKLGRAAMVAAMTYGLEGCSCVC